MTIGDDVAEVLQELGTKVTIIRDSGNITGEVCDFDINTQATKPFSLEHLLKASFPYETQIVPGDIILFTAVSRYYMVMSKTPEMFEDGVVEFGVSLYLCNLNADAVLLRPSESRSPTNYNIYAGWEVIRDTPMYGVLTDRIFGTEIEQDSPVGQVELWRVNLIIPKSYGVKPLDRFVQSDTEYYKVEAIEKYTYPGADLVLLVEDTRSSHVP